MPKPFSMYTVGEEGKRGREGDGRRGEEREVWDQLIINSSSGKSALGKESGKR